MERRRRIVACYCATFLKPEMQHIYRQLSAVKKFRVGIYTYKRENAEAFPFEDVTQLTRSPWRWLQRIIDRQILHRPMLLGRGETRRFAASLVERRCELLHIFFGNSGVQLLPLLRDGRRVWPAVVSFHGADVLVDLDQPAYKEAVLDLCGRVDLVLARSRSLMDALIKMGCPEEKIRLNRTGIPIEKFAYERRQNPGGAFRLLQACRFIEKKGLATSLRAFAIFAKTHPQARLTLAGDGPMRPALEQLAAELGVADRVDFPGFLSQEELKAQLDQSHFFLHPSEMGADGNQEGVPNSLLEAMATGLPAFATTHGGIPEAITHGVNGWLVPEGDHAALAQGLLEFAASSDRLAALGEAAAKSIEQNFSLSVQARQLEGYYQEAIEEAWVSPPGADKV